MSYKQENKYKHNGRRLLNVAMSGAIQMTESEMSCDGCYHLIQVTMQLANANINTNTNVTNTKANTHTKNISNMHIKGD